MRRFALLVSGLALLASVAAAGLRATSTSDDSVPPWRIVYTRDDPGFGGRRGLAMLSSGESRPHALVRSSVENIESLTWAPNGQRVAYTIMIPTWVRGRSEQSRRGMYSVVVSGTARHLTTAFDGGGAWSPDSELIAFARTTVTQHGATEPPTVREALYVVPSAGGKSRLVARGCGAPASSVGTWSPDGKRLVVFCGDAIWVVNADGSGRRRVSQPVDGQVGGPPSWSPDGSLIAYGRRCYDAVGDDLFCDLAVIRPDGRGRRTLRGEFAAGWQPIWFSEGALVFVDWSQASSDYPLVAVDPRTGARRKIHPAPISNVTAGSNGTIGFLDKNSLVILDSKGKRLLRRDLPLPPGPWLVDLWLG